MGSRKADRTGDANYSDPWEELEFYLREIPIKRLKATEGLPILTSDQLHSLNEGVEELLYCMTEYDCFSPGLSEPLPAEPEPEPEPPRRISRHAGRRRRSS